MPIISVKNLKKYYKTYEKEEGFLASLKSFFKRKHKIIKAVDDISFDIEKGEVIGFIGPNGAGKTTTLKCLAGILYPTSGKISVLGFTPFERKTDYLRQISFIMGKRTHLFWDLPPMDSYILWKEIYKIPEATFKKNLHKLSDILRFDSLVKQPVRTLSLGQRMKAEIIAALLHQPKILFLDEPTLGLDIMMQKSLRDFIKEYNKEFGSTIILTSHYMEDVEVLAKRIIIIDKGKLYYDGSLQKLKNSYIKTKDINIFCKENLEKENLEKLGKIKNLSSHYATISVKKEKIAKIVSFLLQHYKVLDLSVKEPNISEIIREVFTKSER